MILEMEHLAHVDAVTEKLGARCADVVDGEPKALNRARRSRRDSFAEDDRARRAGGRQLYGPPVLAAREIGVEPPTHVSVEALGAIDVGHRNHDDLEFRV